MATGRKKSCQRLTRVASNGMSQQMRIRFFVLNELYHNNGRSVSLPSLRELSKRFNIALSTVQLAIEQLRDDGYVICRRGTGMVTNPRMGFFFSWSPPPLVGIKTYNGDWFCLTKTFCDVINPISQELCERGWHMRQLMNATTTSASIERELSESYLDGIVMVFVSEEYARIAEKTVPHHVVVSQEAEEPHRYQIKCLYRHCTMELARRMHQRGLRRVMTTSLENKMFDPLIPFYNYLRSFLPEMELTHLPIDGVKTRQDSIRELMSQFRPDVLIHFNMEIPLVTELAKGVGWPVQLLCLDSPSRDFNYRGWYLRTPTEAISDAVAEMLHRQFAGTAPPEGEIRNFDMEFVDAGCGALQAP